MNLTERISLSQQKRGSLLCVGLDPDPSRHGDNAGVKEIGDFFLETIRLTRESVAGYKANLGFFLAFGAEGIIMLKSLRQEIPADSIFILDGKWGDVGHTVERYAEFGFGYIGADVLTAHPYMGRDGVAPFIKDESKGIFLLCRTSNPNGAEIQMFPCPSMPLFMHVAALASQWNEKRNIGLVVGATFPEEMKLVRESYPDLTFLVPGVGAQGGKAEDVIAAAGDGVLIAASRSLLYPGKEQADPRRVLAAVQETNRQIKSV